MYDQPKLAAAWYRISTDSDRQHTSNQVPAVERFAGHHGYEITKTYVVDDTAWQGGGGPEYKAALKRALDDAWRGEFKVVIVWSLDRITRLGAEDALRLIRQFRERGVTLLSAQEPWLNGSPEIVDVLVAFAGWQAQQESQRRSERIKAGIARRKAEGKSFGGRQAGAKDRKPRKRRSAPSKQGVDQAAEVGMP